jgi:hypothetical protein
MFTQIRSSLDEKPALRRAGVLITLGFAATLLAGCGSDGGDSAPADAESSSSTEAESNDSGSDAGAVDAAVQEDLEAAVAAINEAIPDFPDAAQFVLSSTATEASFVYGAVEVPYTPSEATTDVTGTVNVSDGAFEISGTSAESGTVYTINQDGEITEG